MKKTGCVHLVGAGCGDADLITLRGWNLLRSCDVVIYDDLIAPELLEALPDQVETRYMGKRSSCHSAPQAEICAALVDEARKGRRVVRLKGGDPFLFGRGGEEILALQAAGIPCEEVPGIPSAIAIPAEAGIPVTHRGVSRSVHIVTAHTADTADGLPELDTLAQTSGTLVFLMGLAQLPQIAQRLLGAGMEPQTPAAVLSGGNAPHPAEVRGTLADIVQRVQEAGVLPPAVIVVGAVAALHLTESEARPLSGRTIALTGTTAVTDKLRPALRALGAQVFAAERAKLEEARADAEERFACSEEMRERAEAAAARADGERILAEARLNAVKSEYGAFGEEEDFTSMERFDEIERQYRAFRAFFKKEWRKAKRRIRKEAFADVFAAEDKGGGQDSGKEDGKPGKS